MAASLFLVVGTAILSSVLTLLLFSMIFQRLWRREVELRIRDLHDELGRTVELRVKRAVVESLAEMTTVDVLRDTTWKAAKSGSDFLSDGLNVLLGKRKRLD